MKLANIILIASFVMTGCYSTGQIPSEEYNYGNSYNNRDVSYQTFYDELQPYGNWINYPGYGYVWQPNMGSDFRPYETDGHWVSTVDGWAWASDRSWGWAPFHYGRWLLEPAVGWVWVPGYEWAPAWVTWGRYDNYYAWAPLAPGISIGIGNQWRAPGNYWSYIPYNCIQQHNLNRYIVRNNRNPVVVNNITIINNYNTYNKADYYHRGPSYQEVERYTHTTIRPVAIASADRPGISRVDNRNRFEVYRPNIAVANNTSANSARPQRITNFNEIRSGDQRSASATGRMPSAANINVDGQHPVVVQDNAQGVQRVTPQTEAENNNPAITDQRNNNEYNRGNRRIMESQPATGASNLDRLQQAPAATEDMNQRLRTRRLQQVQPTPNAPQPAYQNNNRVQNDLTPNQPSAPVIRQAAPQRQLQDNRQFAPPARVQVERQRTFNPAPPRSVNSSRPVLNRAPRHQ